MSRNNEFLPGDDLMDVARKWYLKLEDEAGNDRVQDQFEQWINKDSSHRDAFDCVVDFWAHIDSMPEIQEIREAGSDIIGESPGASEQDIIVNIIQKKSVKEAGAPWRKWPRWAVAATVLITGMIAISLYDDYQPEGTYMTATGEQKVIHLADGSTVYLNTHSKLRVDFTDKIRDVHLLEGEARFDVEKDKARPFVVETSRGNIRAVGTSFNIYDSDDTVEIIVFKGTIAVNGKKDQPARDNGNGETGQKPVLVSGGERIVAFDRGLGPVRMTDKLELLQKKAWCKGKLIFRGQKLSDVIKEMSRYSNRKIFIANDTLNEMKMGGAFGIGDFDAFLNAIEDTFPVRIIRFTPYISVIIEA